MFSRKYLVVAVATSSVALSVQLQAQEVEALRGENFTLEEVLVTARKKTENLQSVPIAIDAISTQQLEEKAITTLRDVAKYTPALTFEQGVLPNDTRPTIRGVNISRGRPNVGILIDGIDVSSETLTVAGGGAFANLGFLDLERIEVIKGPQSVTYGRSAFSGAVNYITKRPRADQGVYGYVEGEVNDYEYGRLTGGLTVPVVQDRAAIGVNLMTSDFDGYYENPNTGGDLGGIEEAGGAFSFNYVSDGDFSAYFRVEYADVSYTPNPVVFATSVSTESAPDDFLLLGSIPPWARNMPIPGGARGLPEPTNAECAAARPFTYLVGQSPACAGMLEGEVSGFKEKDIDLSPNPNTGKDFVGTDIENTRLSLELQWRVGDVDIVSLTGYTDNETTIEEDFDKTDFDLETLGVGSARLNPQYSFADPFGNPPDLTPLNNNPEAENTQFGANTNSDTSFDYDQFSQEFRFTGVAGNLEWMADLLYWEENMDSVMNQMWWLRESADADYWNSLLSRQVDPTCTQPGDVNSCLFFTGVQETMEPNPIPFTRDTEHWSIAASFVYNFTDSVRGTAEGRYLEETIDYTGVPLDTFVNGLLNLPYFDPETGSTVPETQKQQVKEEKFVPRFGLDWQITDTFFSYASAGMGFKPGGIATTDGNGDIMSGHYDPETLWAYELGFKSDLLSNRLRLNGAIFYNDYTDQQVPYFVRSDLGVNNVSITNAGESEIYGFEIEAIYRPSSNWTFLASWTHSETEYKDFNISDVGTPSTYDKVQSGNEEGDFSGKEFPNTPKDVAILSIRFDGEFSNGVGYFTELFGNYRSKRYIDQGNLSYIPSIFLTDFSAGIVSEHWQVTAYVNNLTDEDDIQSGLGNVSFGFLPAGQTTPFAANLTLPAPRTFGVRARYRF